MVYAFTIAQAEQPQEFGLVAADSIEEAEDIVFECFDREECQHFSIEEGAESLLDQQYNCIALLTTV